MISIVKELSSKLFNDIYIECYGRPANHLDLEDYLKRAKACEAITAGQLKKILSEAYHVFWWWSNDAIFFRNQKCQDYRDDLNILYGINHSS